MSLRSSLLVTLASAALASLAPLAQSAPQTYFYGGESTPDSGAYGALFTTVGPVGNTSWSSNGDVLSMNTALGQGIWFGRGSSYGDEAGFSLADGVEGNLVRARLALAPGADAWSLYWFDKPSVSLPQNHGAIFSFATNGFSFDYIDGTNQYVSTFRPVADMTAFHTYTSYVLAGQVSYFFDGEYLGGGKGPTSNFVSNFVLFGDASATTLTGVGSMLVDSFEIITAVGSDAPAIAVPEPSTYPLFAAGLAGMGAVAARRRRSPRT